MKNGFTQKYKFFVQTQWLIFVCVPWLQAQSNWRTEADSIQHVIKAATDTTTQLAAEIKAWKKQGAAHLTGRQQTQWAVQMAALNRYHQTLIAYSGHWETARQLAPEELAQRFGLGTNDKNTATLEHLQLLTHLLAADRALYVMTDTLRFAVENTRAIRQRLNEGNRSFGVQYGIFTEMRANYFDPARNRRTRSRFLRLRAQANFLEKNKPAVPELYRLATQLLLDPTLQKIAAQSDLAVFWASSLAGFGSIAEPAADLTTHTFQNLSQFFGNLVGTYVFKIANLFGIGESRGHALPDFYRYYSHPAGAKKGLHPAKVTAVANELRAGDILFDKTRFAITDKLIPGYLGHVAIYLDSYDALRRLGVLESPPIRLATNGMSPNEIEAELAAYAAELAAITAQEKWVRFAIMRRRIFAKTFNGRPLNPLLFEALYRLRAEQENVIEALRDGQAVSSHEGGVTLNHFAHFLYVDDYAAVRLRQGHWRAEQYRGNLAHFLALALLQYGKPYDFQFDVNTLDAIVCSELIYQSFVDIDFKTGKSLASYTIAPDQVAQEAGVQTVLDTLKIDPPFELLQWYAEAAPLYPAVDSTASADTLAARAFMAMVREENGGLNLLAPSERKQFAAIVDRAKSEREKERDRLRLLPVTKTLPISPQPDLEAERRLQKFYAELNRKMAQARAAGKSEEEIAAKKQREIEAFGREQEAASPERIAALTEDFRNWQAGAAYNPSYVDLYSGPARFLLSIFRSAGVADDNGFGRGLDWQFAVTNEAPQQSLIYSQHYAFLPFHLQFFNNSGHVRKTVQGGAMLARLARRFTQGDYIELKALEWRNDAFATAYLPFTLEAGGDKGPLAVILNLTTVGNGHHQHGLYIGEKARVELAPFERRQRRNAFAAANLFYGGRAQFTLGQFRWYATGELGTRLGELGERQKQTASTNFPPLRAWTFGAEFAGTTLYRPSGHRLEFSVSEDESRFIGGRLQRDRQMRISYRWAVND